MSSPTFPDLKVCKKCGEGKAIDYFYAHKKTKDGHAGSCKACDAKMERLNYQRNRDRYRAQKAAYRKRDPKRFAAWDRINHLRQFGITVADYELMFAEQCGVCAICEGVNKGGRRLAVDHNHTTGAVRALLCSQCNTSLGKMKDSPALLRKAAIYIEKHNEKGASCLAS